MVYYHFCQAYTQSATSQVDRIVKKILLEYSNQESLKGIGKISSFTGGLYVLTVKTPYSEIILEEQKIQIEDRDITVYFVRGFKNGLQDYVEIRDGKWLIYNPIPMVEIENFKNSQKRELDKKVHKDPPPHDLISWQNEYKLRVEYDIYETENWVKFAFNNSLEDGMKSDEAKLYRLVLLEVFKDSNNLESEILSEGKNEQVIASQLNDTGIIYSKILVDNKTIYLLHNGANTKSQSANWNKIKGNIKPTGFESIKDISSMALKAYPNWVLNDADLWAKIEKNNEMGNLSLLPEQTAFLKGFKFPKYINGQAGSGKSTMLYYLFANAYYYKYAGVIKGDIIFLTENEKLLTHTKKSVYDLLLFNPEFDLSSEDIAITNVDKHFCPFKKFLLDLLPLNSKDFSPDKYLNFSKFKLMYEGSNIATFVKNKYSAELVWFTMSTYVYGNDLTYQITSENYEEKMPKEGKEIISAENLCGIEKEIIKPFYEKLLLDGYWDKIKLIKYLNETTEIRKRYDIIFCDEAQDFSRVELEFILKLSSYTQYNLINVEQFPIVFAGDALQTVNPTGFRTEVLTSMIYKELTDENIGFKLEANQLEFTPTYNYRSSQAIVNVANAIQYYRKKELGAVIKSFQISKRPTLFENEHLNVFVNMDTFFEDTSLQRKVEYKTIILPVNSDEIERYKLIHPELEKFKNVISAVDAKGIDFSEVVVFGFGEFKEKHSLEGFEDRFFFNKLYVAITRAQTELVIIDSEESKTNFWIELIEKYLKSNWNQESELKLKRVEDIIIFDAHEIIQSSSDIVENDAIRQKEQGVIEKNIPLLQVASSHFIKIDNKKQYYLCLGEIEEIKENYLKASEHYLNKYVGEEGIEKAINVFWNGKQWNELIALSKNSKNYDKQIRPIIAKIFQDNVLFINDLKRLNTQNDSLRKLLNETIWRKEFIQKMIGLINISYDTEEISLISDLLESICTKNDENVWDILGEKYYQEKKFEAAINAFEKIGSQNLLMLHSKLEIARRKNDYEEIIILLGRLAIEGDLKKSEVASEIINYYNGNTATLSNTSNIYLKQYVYFAHLIKKSDDGVLIDFAKKVEYQFFDRKSELADGYLRLLKYPNLDKQIFSFLIERWVKLKFSEGTDIDMINAQYKEIASINDNVYTTFSEAEILEIPIIPSQITSKFSEHIKNIQIKNFRQFKDISISNFGLFNLVVGDNNIGKTSFLESLLFIDDKETYLERLAFAYIERSNIFPDKIETSKDIDLSYTIKEDFIKDFKNLEFPDNNIEFTFRDKRNLKSYEILFDDNRNTNASSYLINYTPFDYEFLKNIPYLNGLKQPFIPFGKGFSNDLAQIYYSEIISNADGNVEKNFIKNVRLFIPKLERITANPKDGVINIRDAEFPNLLRPLHQYGEGANKLFRILILLTLNKGKKLLIDEIDAGIHYTRFKQFWEIILRIAMDDQIQIIATTHNEECIRFFGEVLDKLGEKFQIESRILQMKFVKDIKVRSFEYNSFNLAIEDGVEIRGGEIL